MVHQLCRCNAQKPSSGARLASEAKWLSGAWWCPAVSVQYQSSNTSTACGGSGDKIAHALAIKLYCGPAARL